MLLFIAILYNARVTSVLLEKKIFDILNYNIFAVTKSYDTTLKNIPLEIIRDIICQVYAGHKSRKTIDLILNTFIPEYDKLNLDYASRLDDEKYVFKTEDELINYFLENTGLNQTFYWNKIHNNPEKIMVGANITEDDKLIMSLTFDGTLETERKYFEKLKNILNSDFGVISYIYPVDYNNGIDFVNKYEQKIS